MGGRQKARGGRAEAPGSPTRDRLASAYEDFVRRQKTRPKWTEMRVGGMPPKALIGRCCKVFWPLDDEWYKGVIFSYDPRTSKHLIVYDGFESEWLLLAKERLQLHLSPCDDLLLLAASSTTEIKTDTEDAEARGEPDNDHDARDLGVDSLEPGSIVWAKVKGHPWWPSLVLRPEVWQEMEMARPVAANCSLVYFFGGTGHCCGVPKKGLLPFKKGLAQGLHTKCHTADFGLSMAQVEKLLDTDKLPPAMAYWAEDGEADDESSEDEDEDESEEDPMHPGVEGTGKEGRTTVLGQQSRGRGRARQAEQGVCAGAAQGADGEGLQDSFGNQSAHMRLQDDKGKASDQSTHLKAGQGQFAGSCAEESRRAPTLGGSKMKEEVGFVRKDISSPSAGSKQSRGNKRNKSSVVTNDGVSGDGTMQACSMLDDHREGDSAPQSTLSTPKDGLHKIREQPRMATLRPQESAATAQWKRHPKLRSAASRGTEASKTPDALFFEAPARSPVQKRECSIKEAAALASAAGPGPGSLGISASSLQVMCPGRIVTTSPRFHTRKAIFPQGYVAVRMFPSTQDPTKLVRYRMEILASTQHGSRASKATVKPLFSVTPEDAPKCPVEADSPTTCWREIKKKVQDARSSWLSKAIAALRDLPEPAHALPAPSSLPLLPIRAHPASCPGGIQGCGRTASAGERESSPDGDDQPFLQPLRLFQEDQPLQLQGAGPSNPGLVEPTGNGRSGGQAMGGQVASEASTEAMKQMGDSARMAEEEKLCVFYAKVQPLAASGTCTIHAPDGTVLFPSAHVSSGLKMFGLEGREDIQRAIQALPDARASCPNFEAWLDDAPSCSAGPLPVATQRAAGPKQPERGTLQHFWKLQRCRKNQASELPGRDGLPILDSDTNHQNGPEICLGADLRACDLDEDPAGKQMRVKGLNEVSGIQRARANQASGHHKGNAQQLVENMGVVAPLRAEKLAVGFGWTEQGGVAKPKLEAEVLENAENSAGNNPGKLQGNRTGLANLRKPGLLPRAAQAEARTQRSKSVAHSLKEMEEEMQGMPMSRPVDHGDQRSPGPAAAEAKESAGDAMSTRGRQKARERGSAKKGADLSSQHKGSAACATVASTAKKQVSPPGAVQQHSSKKSVKGPMHFEPVTYSSGATKDKCDVCNHSEEYEDNQMLQCDKCRILVHMECYGVVEPPDGDLWLCQPCQHECQLETEHKEAVQRATSRKQGASKAFPSDQVDRTCALCPVQGGAMKRTVEGGWVHVLCTLWIPETCFVDARLMEPVDGVKRIAKARLQLRCSLCKVQHGACVQCAYGNCCTAFHPLCARYHGLHMSAVKPEEKRRFRLHGTALGSVVFVALCRRHGGSVKGLPAPEPNSDLEQAARARPTEHALLPAVPSSGRQAPPKQQSEADIADTRGMADSPEQVSPGDARDGAQDCGKQHRSSGETEDGRWDGWRGALTPPPFCQMPYQGTINIPTHRAHSTPLPPAVLSASMSDLTGASLLFPSPDSCSPPILDQDSESEDENAQQPSLLPSPPAREAADGSARDMLAGGQLRQGTCSNSSLSSFSHGGEVETTTNCARLVPYNWAVRRARKAPEAIAAALAKRTFLQSVPYVVSGRRRTPVGLLPQHAEAQARACLASAPSVSAGPLTLTQSKWAAAALVWASRANRRKRQTSWGQVEDEDDEGTLQSLMQQLAHKRQRVDGSGGDPPAESRGIACHSEGSQGKGLGRECAAPLPGPGRQRHGGCQEELVQGPAGAGNSSPCLPAQAKATGRAAGGTGHAGGVQGNSAQDGAVREAAKAEEALYIPGITSAHGAAPSAELLSMSERFRRIKASWSQRLAFGKSAIHGWGVFVRVPHAAGDMVIEYAGQVVRPIIADMREKRTYNDLVGAGTYMFRVDQGRVVDATRVGSIAHLINHSCQPNCYSRVVSASGEERVIIFARRNLEVGEELTYDYRFQSQDEQLQCNCGAPGCRGVVNKEQDADEEEDGLAFGPQDSTTFAAPVWAPLSQLQPWRPPT